MCVVYILSMSILEMPRLNYVMRSMLLKRIQLPLSMCIRGVGGAFDVRTWEMFI